MHRQNVVHRDINPSNVIYMENKLIKILDFNVSKLIEKKEDDENTKSKYKFLMFTKTGTPIYTAPEMH